MSELSQLRPIGFYASQCGYCKSNDRQQQRSSDTERQQPDGQPTATSDDQESSQSQFPETAPESRAAYYARAVRLHPADYQSLLNHGWRRSGTLLYKPEMRYSCCPHYTIRLPVRDLTIRRDQRSACNRWNKFVLGDDYDKKAARLHPKSREKKAQDRNIFNLEEAMHRAEYSNLPAEPAPLHNFEVELEPVSFTQEKYQLYVDYQTTIHKEPLSECSENGFRRFLCDSPLISTDQSDLDGQPRCGSFHQCYRLDGRLIAMGVLDLLPQSVSAVYFMYLHEFETFSFGKLSALREASFARENGYEYYQMGYYIHSCGKMRYKNDFQPQYFLDLADYGWHRLDEDAQKQMDQYHYYSPQEFAREAGFHSGAAHLEAALTGSVADEPDARTRATLILSVLEQKYRMEGLSLFDVNFAGMQPFEEIADFIDMIPINIPRSNKVYHTSVGIMLRQECLTSKWR